MMRVNLHELINAPGAGTARSVLKKAKLWDEYAGLPERQFRVRVSYVVSHEGEEIVTVAARCAKEAEEKACDKIEDDHEYDVEFGDVEVLA